MDAFALGAILHRPFGAYSVTGPPASWLGAHGLIDYKKAHARHAKIDGTPPVLLKLDVEGAEFTLLPHLIDSGLLYHATHLLLEWHLDAMPPRAMARRSRSSPRLRRPSRTSLRRRNAMRRHLPGVLRSLSACGAACADRRQEFGARCAHCSTHNSEDAKKREEIARKDEPLGRPLGRYHQTWYQHALCLQDSVKTVYIQYSCSDTHSRTDRQFRSVQRDE